MDSRQIEEQRLQERSPKFFERIELPHIVKQREEEKESQWNSYTTPTSYNRKEKLATKYRRQFGITEVYRQRLGASTFFKRQRQKVKRRKKLLYKKTDEVHKLNISDYRRISSHDFTLMYFKHKSRYMTPKQKWRMAASRAFLAACVVEQLLKIKREAHLFGTSRRMLTEIETMIDKHPRMVLKPESSVRWIWEIIIGIMLLYSAIAMPLQIAFQESPNQVRVAFDLVIDFFFLFDVVLSFFTGYRDSKQGGVVVLNHKKIAVRYLRTWFFIDLSASIPWQLLDILTCQGNFLYFKILRIFRMLQLLKYFKLVKTKKKQRCRIDDSKKYPLELGIRRICQATILVIFFSHLIACLWYLLAKLNHFHPDTWVV